MKKRGTKVPNHMRKIQHVWKLGALLREAGLHQVSVEHDDWCGMWHQQRCHGDPDVRHRFNLDAPRQKGAR